LGALHGSQDLAQQRRRKLQPLHHLRQRIGPSQGLVALKPPQRLQTALGAEVRLPKQHAQFCEPLPGLIAHLQVVVGLFRHGQAQLDRSRVHAHAGVGVIAVRLGGRQARIGVLKGLALGLRTHHHGQQLRDTVLVEKARIVAADPHVQALQQLRLALADLLKGRAQTFLDPAALDIEAIRCPLGRKKGVKILRLPALKSLEQGHRYLPGPPL
jgi:hypothetical protein